MKNNATYFPTAEKAQEVYEDWRNKSKSLLAQTHRKKLLEGK